jgi:hypothetical protein
MAVLLVIFRPFTHLSIALSLPLPHPLLPALLLTVLADNPAIRLARRFSAQLRPEPVAVLTVRPPSLLLTARASTIEAWPVGTLRELDNLTHLGGRISHLNHGVFDTERGGEEDTRSEVLGEVENGKCDARAREVLV